MSTLLTSFFKKSDDPLRLAIFMLACGLLTTLGSALVKALGLLSVSERFPWMSAAAYLLMFSVANSINSLSVKGVLQFWSRSVYSFMGLALASGLFAWAFSSLSINEAGSFRWIFIVLTIGYLIFMGIMAWVRKIVEFAQREEWTQPRLRHKKRR